MMYVDNNKNKPTSRDKRLMLNPFSDNARLIRTSSCTLGEYTERLRVAFHRGMVEGHQQLPITEAGISIISYVDNNEEFGNLLDSYYAQTYKNKELIVVCDLPEQDLREDIHIITCPQQLYVGINNGIRIAKGSIFVFWDPRFIYGPYATTDVNMFFRLSNAVCIGNDITAPKSDARMNQAYFARVYKDTLEPATHAIRRNVFMRFPYTPVIVKKLIAAGAEVRRVPLFINKASLRSAPTAAISSTPPTATGPATMAARFPEHEPLHRVQLDPEKSRMVASVLLPGSDKPINAKHLERFEPEIPTDPNSGLQQGLTPEQPKEAATAEDSSSGNIASNVIAGNVIANDVIASNVIANDVIASNVIADNAEESEVSPRNTTENNMFIPTFLRVAYNHDFFISARELRAARRFRDRYSRSGRH